ncbi:MAG TPA: DinB family protein [Planococcus sp. (in: firmicutes)]|nr:DinB family protein [Planococcus sp. (in: firmicutes)]
MFNSLADFFRFWHEEAAKTQQILDGLTDESLQQQVTADHRTLGRLAWHLTTTLDEMMGHAGLKFEASEFGSPMPKTANAIAEAYRKSNESMVAAMQEQWSDRTLAEERDMYGEMWTVSAVLTTLITHQIHHRGQMTVLMRQAGLKVPGLYGPAKEEWAAIGQPAPEV